MIDDSQLPVPLQFVDPGSNFTKGRKGDIKWWTIHDMEAPERLHVAKDVARWLGRDSVRASVHYCIDSTELISQVGEHDTAWHAPGASHAAIGVEHAGYARQSRSEWLDPFSRAMLEISAALFAVRGIGALGIPAVWLDVDDMLAGRPGVHSHATASKAWKRSTHWDPGPNFPHDYWFERVAYWLEHLGIDPDFVEPAKKVPGMARLIEAGSTGPDVDELRATLISWFPEIFGPGTNWIGTFAHPIGMTWTAKFIDVQRKIQTYPDGIWGPKSAHALNAYQRKIGQVIGGVLTPLTYNQKVDRLWVEVFGDRHPA